MRSGEARRARWRRLDLLSLYSTYILVRKVPLTSGMFAGFLRTGSCTLLSAVLGKDDSPDVPAFIPSSSEQSTLM